MQIIRTTHNALKPAPHLTDQAKNDQVIREKNTFLCGCGEIAEKSSDASHSQPFNPHNLRERFAKLRESFAHQTE